MIQESKTYGIASPLDLLHTTLKREVLFFDHIAIPNILRNFIFQDRIMQCPIRAVEYLIENEIIIDPVENYIGHQTYLKKIGIDVFRDTLAKIEKRDKFLAAQLSENLTIEINNDLPILNLFYFPWVEAVKRISYSIEKIASPFRKFGASIVFLHNRYDYDRRGIAIDLRKNHSLDAFPIYSNTISMDDDFILGKNDVVNIILKSIPEPQADSEPWEKIIDFRNDPDTKKKLVRLRHWISDIAESNKSQLEIVEELEYCYNQYEEHIKFHQMKIRKGVLETIIMIPAEAIEGILRLKPTKTLKTLFSVKHKKLELLEAELKAPNRDLAYLFDVNEKFASAVSVNSS